MIGGLLKSTSIAALVAVAGLSIGAMSAQAADLGGDCCADLEERIAELEATTARKGNRKVSLTISGFIAQDVFWWDDGTESNVYQGTSGHSASRFRFKGDAKINSDLSAGYYMEIQVQATSVGSVTADADDVSGAVSLRQSNWYLKSATYGKVTVGQGSSATDDIVHVNLGNTGPLNATINLDHGAGLRFRASGTGAAGPVDFGNFWEDIDTARRNVVRYDTPVFGGFIASAAWGEDDFWDVALRFAQDVGDFKIAFGVGYLQDTDRASNGGGIRLAAYNFGRDFDEVKGSASILHNPTGLFATYAGAFREFNASNGLGALGDQEMHWVKAGIYQKFLPYGKTTIFGEWGQSTGYAEGVDIGGGFGTITDSEASKWGIGLVQHIDAAAMEVFVGYRQFSADLDGTAANSNFDDIDTVYSGARIQF